MSQSYAINRSRSISETLDGETIIIDLETGSYYSMNPAGTAVWEAIAANTSIDTAEPSVTAFLETLTREGLIAETNEPNSSAPFSVPGTPTVEKYSDMEEMLLADPIHDVDTAGWPKMKDAE